MHRHTAFGMTPDVTRHCMPSELVAIALPVDTAQKLSISGAQQTVPQLPPGTARDVHVTPFELVMMVPFRSTAHSSVNLGE